MKTVTVNVLSEEKPESHSLAFIKPENQGSRFYILDIENIKMLIEPFVVIKSITELDSVSNNNHILVSDKIFEENIDIVLGSFLHDVLRTAIYKLEDYRQYVDKNENFKCKLCEADNLKILEAKEIHILNTDLAFPIKKSCLNYFNENYRTQSIEFKKIISEPIAIFDDNKKSISQSNKEKEDSIFSKKIGRFFSRVARKFFRSDCSKQEEINVFYKINKETILIETNFMTKKKLDTNIMKKKFKIWHHLFLIKLLIPQNQQFFPIIFWLSKLTKI
ncbi:hypothetical protein EDEG_02075 [Edhazardia aedis USNM 41457]|uniref:Uncharacterized protein n=1 Tax=Edhazardia aedis (strain USNM 41457) TaxID=1003232 RepID=J9DQL9_EDHAE|nr:hypothetical protein EDEG_02075 [Edhazardia aedis USNM 41457]|eukprot:EJW03607.1 hypothetical protein EDEG_02075 [Edhazardia aedis USNM 41457]